MYIKVERFIIGIRATYASAFPEPLVYSIYGITHIRDHVISHKRAQKDSRAARDSIFRETFLVQKYRGKRRHFQASTTLVLL